MTISKYRAVPTVVDGIRFASMAEARRYQELRLLEKAGKIRNLKLQPKFPLLVNGIKVGTYIADFGYELPNGPSLRDAVSKWSMVVPATEDVKGVLTPMYRLKKKMVFAQYGITITEVA